MQCFLEDAGCTGLGLGGLLLLLALLNHLAAAVRLVNHRVIVGRVRRGRLGSPTFVSGDVSGDVSGTVS